MDNITHTLCGLGLARAGASRLAPLATPTLLIGANLPDLDIVGQAWGGLPFYLCHHRGVTHGVLPLLLQAVALAALMTWLARRRHTRVPFRGLLAASLIGLASHPLLDLLNTYGVRPWLPFDATRYHGDTAFIVDPWLWLAFGGAACLGGPRTATSRRSWLLLSGLAIGIIAAAAGAGRVPAATPWFWAAGACVVALMRQRGFGGRRPRTAAGLALAAAGLYLGALAVGSAVARERGAAQLRRQLLPGERVEAVSVHPAPALPWSWMTLVATQGRILRVRLDLRRGTVSSLPVLRRRLDDPALPWARTTPAGQAWRCFARHPYCAREGNQLILDDARYLDVRGGPGWSHQRLTVPARLRR